jgi:phage-Barnase-EndoU-ColicinE5/D-RelE like nuclease2
MRFVKNAVQPICIDVTRIVKPPESLEFSSLAELYERFCALLVGREFYCPRRIRIIVMPRHFFHLTKLQKGSQTEFEIDIEESRIKATTEGFGEYAINEKRSKTLSWIPEIMTEPHEIWEYEKRKTADEVFIREYDKPGSPFRNVLLKREADYLTPVTCMTVRRTGIKEHRKGKKLWPL